MLRKLLRSLARYPVVVATLAVGLVGGALEITGQATSARWVISAFAIIVALMQVRGMVDDLRAGSYGIDLLAVTAIGSTVVVGEYWAALVVCLMLSGGEALEDYAANRAKAELTGLLENAPRTAHLLGPGDQLTDVPVEQVVVGDRLLVRPFEVVPVDGVLESDAATLDESSLTGESLPVDRRLGDELLSGAINGGEAIEVRVTAPAAESQYQSIIELVRQAQESRAPFVRLADRVAVPFTIGALTLAIAAWIVSGDPTRMAEVLVVATPCPLIIAAPVAFMGGMSRSARNGVIVKDSATLEQLAGVRTAAFDKTGTLTYGEPRVTDIHALDIAADELLMLAAAVEQYSSHPWRPPSWTTPAQPGTPSQRPRTSPRSPPAECAERSPGTRWRREALASSNVRLGWTACPCPTEPPACTWRSISAMPDTWPCPMNYEPRPLQRWPHCTVPEWVPP